MKVGIYGGSFNPPHKFHREIVEYLLKNKYLDKVIVEPAGDNYKKKDLAKFVDRIEMVKLAFQDIADISTIGNEGYDYTYEVMDYYKKQYPNDELYFICGEDNINEIMTWRNAKYLTENYKFLVIGRNNLKVEDKPFIVKVAMKENDMSSTMIREKIKNNENVDNYLDNKVRDYIYKHNLYDHIEYKTEEEFLKNYDPSIYPRFAVATDIIVFGISSKDKNDYRRLDEKKMSVLLIKRDDYPYKGKWCLPGGFVHIDEDLDDAPRRVLFSETGINNIYLEQLYTYGSVDRDPRMRVVSSSYMALIDKDRMDSELKNESSWFDIIDVEYKPDKVIVKLSNGEEDIDFTVKRVLKEHTTDRYAFSVLENNYLSFDNPLIIVSGMERLKNKLLYTDIVFNMMPKLFTLGELQKVYEVILGKKLLDPAFRRVIKDKVEETDEFKTGEGHRPSKLFKYKESK